MIYLPTSVPAAISLGSASLYHSCLSCQFSQMEKTAFSASLSLLLFVLLLFLLLL